MDNLINDEEDINKTLKRVLAFTTLVALAIIFFIVLVKYNKKFTGPLGIIYWGIIICAFWGLSNIYLFFIDRDLGNTCIFKCENDDKRIPLRKLFFIIFILFVGGLGAIILFLTIVLGVIPLLLWLFAGIFNGTTEFLFRRRVAPLE